MINNDLKLTHFPIRKFFFPMINKKKNIKHETVDMFMKTWINTERNIKNQEHGNINYMEKWK